MTQEEKAKAYDEAIERAKMSYHTGDYDKDTLEMLEIIFPELKESDDDRIRKGIIRNLEYLADRAEGFVKDELKERIAWLEKQEQKPTDEDMKKALRTEYEKGRADAIAEIQKPVDCIDCTNSKGCINCKDGNIKETLVRNPAWSEEDECYMSECIGAIATKDGWSFEEKRKTKHWLKSLKDRVQPQKQEWREEDDKKLEWLCRIIHSCKVRKGISLAEESEIGSWVDKWLNYAPQSQWNPSDEQIKAIRLARSFVTDDFGEHNTLSEILIELEAQLKKLKG